MTDYEILGIDTNADEKTIKKAYFRLIRTHSPEKDPEKFQQIRAAYERLSNPKEQERMELDFPLPNHPFAEIYSQNILCEMEAHNFKKAMKCAEEALKYIGENAYFTLCLAIACEREEMYGKAAKQYEKLLKEYPDNYIICAKLAVAYLHRGYHKKAFPYFEKAFQNGVQEKSFLFSYIECAKSNEKDQQFEQGILVLLEKANKQEYRKNIFDYCLIFEMYTEGNEKKYKHIPDILNYYYMYTVAIKSKFQEYKRELTFLFTDMKKMAEKVKLEEDEKLKKATELLMKDCLDMELLKDNECMSLYIKLERDKRFSEIVKIMAECFLIPVSEMGEFGEVCKRFGELDATLCLIEEWDELKSEFAIIEKEFPEFYHRFDSVWQIMNKGDKELERYKERLLKEYDRQQKNFNITLYYTRHPEKRPVAEEIQWDSLEIGTFQRDNKKVGRNEPCPCGSGKKYKRCCGG